MVTNTTKRSVSPVSVSTPISRDTTSNTLVNLKKEFDEIKALVTVRSAETAIVMNDFH